MHSIREVVVCFVELYQKSEFIKLVTLHTLVAQKQQVFFIFPSSWKYGKRWNFSLKCSQRVTENTIEWPSDENKPPWPLKRERAQPKGWRHSAHRDMRNACRNSNFGQNGDYFMKGCENSELINVFVWKSIRNSDTPKSEHSSRKCVIIHQTANKHTKQRIWTAPILNGAS